MKKTYKNLLLFLHNILSISHAPIFCLLRCYLLRLMAVNIQDICDTSGNLFILNGSKLKIGANSTIGLFAKIYDFESIEIGESCLISHQFTVISGTHYNSDSRKYLPAPVIIGNNVWIGINVTIVGPVHIGDNSTIGASSLVIRDVPSNTTVGGIPARSLKKVQK